MRTLLIVMMLCAASSFAQGSPSEGQREKATQRLTELSDRLKLTPEQRSQVEPIIAGELSQLKALRQEYGDPRSASMRTKRQMAKKAKSIREDADKKLKAVLSASQMKELERFRQETREEFKEGRASRQRNPLTGA